MRYAELDSNGVLVAIREGGAIPVDPVEISDDLLKEIMAGGVWRLTNGELTSDSLND